MLTPAFTLDTLWELTTHSSLITSQPPCTGKEQFISSARQRFHEFSTVVFSNPSRKSANTFTTAQLRGFLYRELWAVDLERMAPHLWIMSTQSSSNVSPPHQQKVKGRKIIVTEDPRLHLIWIYDRVFIKPLPRYLLSYTFWLEHMSNEKSTLRGSNEEEQKTCTMIRMSALGFLRIYYYLIQHESDFEIACNEIRILPSDITWTEFCAFSQDFFRRLDPPRDRLAFSIHR